MAKFVMRFTSHPGQKEIDDYIVEHDPDIITVCASRGWGKSIWVTCKILIPYLLGGNNRQAMWVAPTYKICQSPIDDVWFGIDDETGKRFITEIDEESQFRFWDYKKADGEMHMFNGSKLYVRSATNAESIVSKGYGLIIIDEAALISREVFQKQILPTARRKGCKIFLISTPRGKNWFHQMYLDGKDFAKKRYASFKQPWWKRPDYPELLRDLMKDLPERLRKQEFEAEFIDNGGGVFINIESVFHGVEIEFSTPDQMWKHEESDLYVEKEGVILSVDLAKNYDYTVLIAVSLSSKQVVYYHRFNKTDYKVVINRIFNTSNMLGGCDVIYDATGVGVGIGDFLDQELNSHPFIFTNQSKSEIIQRLMVAFEYNNIRIPNITTIKNEHEIFEYAITRTGKMSYSAPEGKNDDTVVALAMANYYIEENGSGDIQEIDNFIKIMNSAQKQQSVWDQIANDNS